MSDAYNIRPGGSLKFKAGVSDGGVVKKKKKKSKAKQEAELQLERERAKEEALKQETSSLSPRESGRNSPAVVSDSSKKTEAEKRFEEAQRQRLEQRVTKLARKTHKDRVAEFNNYLESLSEHHDIPKVGPG
jgi:protein FAM32A